MNTHTVINNRELPIVVSDDTFRKLRTMYNEGYFWAVIIKDVEDKIHSVILQYAF